MIALNFMGNLVGDKKKEKDEGSSNKLKYIAYFFGSIVVGWVSLRNPSEFLGARGVHGRKLAFYMCLSPQTIKPHGATII